MYSMQKTILFLVSCLFLTVDLFSQTPCSLDPTFNVNGKLISDAERIGERIAVLSDGSILVAYNPFSNGHAYVRHLLSDGTVDMTYGTMGKTILEVASLRTDINALLVKNDELYICGNTGTGSNTYAYVSKLKANGQIDITFGNAGYVAFTTYFTFNDMVFEPGTQKIIVTGMKSVTKSTIARLHANGFMDASFGTLGSTEVASGNSSTYYQIEDIHIDYSNKYVITGKYYTTMGIPTFTQVVVMRYETDGSLDHSFDTDGKVFLNSAATGSYEEGRKIFATINNDYYICCGSYVNGSNWNYGLVKLQSNGLVDHSFGSNGWRIYDLTNQGETEVLLNAEMMSNGNILMTGNQGSGDTVHFALLMVKPDGTVDHTFAPNGLFMHIFGTNNNSSSSGLALTQDGKLFLSGYTRTCTGGTCGILYLAIAKYNVGYAPNAIVNLRQEKDLLLYPNPIHVNGVFSLAFDQQHIRAVEAYDIFGKKVKLDKIGEKTYQLIHPAIGNYCITIFLDNGVRILERLVVN